MLRKERTTGTQGNHKDEYLIAAAGVLPIVWIGLKIAPYWHRSVFIMVTKFDEIFAEPLDIQWTEHSLQAVLLCLLVYAMGIGIWLSTRRNYRRGEEHGSAKWGDAKAVNRKYKQHPDNMNKILTQNVKIGFDAHKHRRNLNVLVIGGSGAGKTRFFVKPNVMQANCSMVILDPKGQLKYARALNLPLKFTYFRERRWQKWLNLRLYGILPSTSDSLKMMNLRVNLTVFPIRKST